ncbi:MAG: response regulator [Alphaproteobacteria bacterium]
MPLHDFQRLNVLVVDDNQHMLSLMEGILRGLGFRNIFAVKDPEKAFAEMRITPMDLAFVDWEMQPLTGLEFVNLVRTAKDSPNIYLPIIMLTANTQTANVIKARDTGVNEYLAKPVSPKSVYQRIVSLIENPRGFVRTESYFGPDRRRHRTDYKGLERRKSTPEIEGPNGTPLGDDPANAAGS